jgi:hypothetical protein
LRLFDGQSLVSELALGRVQDVEPQRARILEAFEATSRSYGIYRDLGAYRLRAAYALIGLFVVQILVLRIIGRYYPHDTLARALRPFALVSWIVLGLWLHLVYFGG